MLILIFHEVVDVILRLLLVTYKLRCEFFDPLLKLHELGFSVGSLRIEFQLLGVGVPGVLLSLLAAHRWLLSSFGLRPRGLLYWTSTVAAGFAASAATSC